MNSPKRKQGRPIASVRVSVAFRADRASLKKVIESFPGAKAKGTACELEIRGDGPREAAEKTKALLDLIRAPGSKGFK
ncbi:MAG: hypothetical protein JRN21_01935 [Nitrososphaerota archaeon]|nr:hypothetical protein [Nitrososphaerota archaeon]